MHSYHPGDEPIPGYALVQLLGEGRFGQVWKATDSDGLPLAIKFVPLAESNAGALRPFRMLRQIRHPNLVRLLGLWFRDGAGQILESPDAGQAAELILTADLGERSLLARLRECQAAGEAGIPPDELLGYLEDVARALDFLNEPRHDLGEGPGPVPHGALRPSNILMIGNAVQVADHGLARILQTPPPVEALGYLAPEALLNKPGPASDQYSLAVIYVELRTGHLPLSIDPTNLLSAHLTGSLDLTGLSTDEQPVLRQALSLKPEDRYPSALALAAALRQARRPEPARVQPARKGEDPVRPGNELVPGYRLVRLLGEGGYGQVWEGVAPGGKPCALKIIRELEASASAQEFGILELLKDLEHPHLMELQAYWLLDPDGMVIQAEERQAARASTLVMCTQLAAKNLAERLKECREEGHAGIPLPELLGHLQQAAEGLDYLNAPVHQFGSKILTIQHRDIKPENILLTKNNTVKISDFGLAKMVEGTSATLHTQSRAMTAAYAAPEMFRGKVTRWTDQYSLAITYYRLRTSLFPFDPKLAVYELMMVHLESRLDLQEVPDAERAVLERATHANPESRFESCLELAAALEAACGVAGGSWRRGSNTMPVVKIPQQEAESSDVPDTSRRPPPSVPAWGTRGGSAAREEAGSGPLPPSRTPRLRTMARPSDLKDSDTGRPHTHTAPPEYLSDIQETAPVQAGRPRPSARRRFLRLLLLSLLAIALGGGIGGAIVFTLRPTPTTTPPVSEEPFHEKIARKDFAGALDWLNGSGLPGERVSQLKAEVAVAWLGRVKEDRAGGRLDEALENARKLLARLPDNREAQKIRDELESRHTRLILDALVLIQKDDFSGAGKKLAEAAQQDKAQEEPVASRIKALTNLVALLKKASKEVTGKDVDVLRERLGTPDRTLTETDVRLFRDELNVLLARRVERRVRGPAKPFDWAALRKECADAREANSPWVKAALVECLVQSGDTRGEQWLKARKALDEVKPSPEAGVYVAYARALAAWETNEFAQAARLLAAAIKAHGVTPELKASHRQEQALRRVFRSPIVALRNKGTLAQPFGTPQAAAEALGWLEQAARLPEAAGDGALRTNLALAAWSTEPRDTSRAASLADELLKQKDLADYVRTSDIYLLCLIHAQVQGSTLAGHPRALDSYERALALAQEILHESPDNQDLAQTIFQVLIAPLASGKPLLTGPVDQKLEERLASLCAQAARLLRSDLATWSGVKEAKGEPLNPLERVVDLYAQALRRDRRAEYLARKAFAQAELKLPDPAALEKDADEAIRMDAQCGSGHGLKGMALLLESRKTSDYVDRSTTLVEASKHFARAVELSQKDTAEDQSDLYRLWSSAALELGTYAADLKKKEEYLTAAEKYAIKATELNPRNLDAWDALAYAREDIAALLGRAEKFKDAVKAYDQAIALGFREARPRPWLGRGRCQYRWAEADPADKNRLDGAERDLREVLRRASDGAEGAEAHYWLGSVAVVQRNQTNSLPLKDRLLETAVDSYRAAASLARKNKVPAWEEAALTAGANLALAEARTRKATGDPSAGEYLKQAEEQARDLKKYNRPESALILGQVAFLRGRSREEAIKIFEGGTGKARAQDARSLVNLHIAMVNARLTVPQDLEGALKDAREARGLVDSLGEDRATRAAASGTLGLVLYLQSIRAGMANTATEALKEFRTALKESPDHPTSWMWCWLLAHLLDRKADRTPAETSEMRDRIAEAKKKLPDTRANAPYRESLLKLYDKYQK
jgi:serine/threonine protein kinase/tetratricopeptide (TPR) repeat protein